MKRIYLDHCVVSNISKATSSSWSDTKIGKAISKAVGEGRAEILTSPTEVMEIFLTAKTDDSGSLLVTTSHEQEMLNLRMNCAKTVLEMIEAKHMIEAYEYVVIRELLDHFEELAPGSILTRSYFDKFASSNKQIWLGCLGLLASYKLFGGEKGLEKMKRAKLISRLIHSRFINDPEQFVTDAVKCSKGFHLKDNGEIWAKFETMSIHDIQQEIENNEINSTKIDKTTKKRLQKNKKMIAEAYGAPELGECLSSVFENPILVLLTFNLDIIKKDWGKILGDNSNPPDYLGPASQGCPDDLNLRYKALETLIYSFATKRLFITQLPTKIVLGELEMCLGKGELPTGGLTFDSQHSVNLTRVDIFVTQDGKFANLLKRAARIINETGHHSVQVVTKATEIENALENKT